MPALRPVTHIPDPTKCYVPTCEAENELLLHVHADPPSYADLCMPHAYAVFAGSDLMTTCECGFCQQARFRLGGERQ